MLKRRTQGAPASGTDQQHHEKKKTSMVRTRVQNERERVGEEKYEVTGRRPRGRSKKTWGEMVANDRRPFGLTPNDALGQWFLTWD